MTPRIKAGALALSAAVALFPAFATAECSTASAGAYCVRVVEPSAQPLLEQVQSVAMTNASAPSPLVDVGAVLPRGEFSIIINAEYYGLPAVSDGWVYMRVGRDAYRVDWRTHQVLERVTERTAANF